MKTGKKGEEGASPGEDAKAVVGIRLKINYDDYSVLDLFSNSVKTKGMKLL